MLAHRHEQIEKPARMLISFTSWPEASVEIGSKGESQSASTNLHLHLHGSAPLKNLATPDNQS